MQHGIFRLTLMAILVAAPPSWAQQSEPQVIVAARCSTIIRAAAARIQSHYVDVGAGRRCSKRLLRELDSGTFAAEIEAKALAAKVTRILSDESADWHLALRHRILPVAGSEDMSRSWIQDLPAGARVNHGFQQFRLLAGNIGYLRIRYFAPLDEAKETALAALQLLSNADAFVIDLRGTPGGIPAMARWLCSFFFDKQVHLASMLARGDTQPRKLESLQPFPLPQRPNSPCYVLVDRKTFSAAESFARWLQFQGRAIVVGNRTLGGAQLSPEYRIDDQFVISVPFAHVIDPDGGRWDQGVRPDVETGKTDALLYAHVLALERLHRDSVADDRASLERDLSAARARLSRKS